jgi:uncharacterized protein
MVQRKRVFLPGGIMKFSMLVVASMAAIPVPGAVLAASFDCGKASSTSEKLICADTTLSRMDEELAALYRQARIVAPNKESFSAETLKQWRWREANCSDEACLMRWYADRKAALMQFVEPGQAMAAPSPAARTGASLMDVSAGFVQTYGATRNVVILTTDPAFQTYCGKGWSLGLVLHKEKINGRLANAIGCWKQETPATKITFRYFSFASGGSVEFDIPAEQMRRAKMNNDAELF